MSLFSRGCLKYLKILQKLGERWYAPMRSEVGNVAIVTGASTGIGYTACEYLLENGVENLVMSSSNIKKGERALNQLRLRFPKATLCYIKCDVSKPTEVKNMFDQTLELHGGIDIVFNNAGIFNEVNWQKMLNINIKGLVNCFDCAWSAMSKENGGKGGTIVNNASILGMQPLGGAPVYSGTKHFVIGYTRSYGLPWNWNRSNVRVMALCPGVTLTPLLQQLNIDESLKSKQAVLELSAYAKQHVCFTGQGLITMLKCGKTGSIWVSEGEEVYEISIPDRTTFRV